MYCFSRGRSSCLQQPGTAYYMYIYICLYTYIYVKQCIHTFIWQTIGSVSLSLSPLYPFPLPESYMSSSKLAREIISNNRRTNKQTKIAQALNSVLTLTTGLRMTWSLSLSGARFKPFKTFVLLDGGGAAACTHVRWIRIKSDCRRSDSMDRIFRSNPLKVCYG